MAYFRCNGTRRGEDSIYVMNSLVRPARSLSQALFASWEVNGQLWLFWTAPLGGAVAVDLPHSWLGAEGSEADGNAAAQQAAAAPGEAPAPATAREPP